jgi:hypothetical protein
VGQLSSAIIVIVSVMAGVPAFAENPSPPLPPLPSTGFVPPYEITRIVRGAGFEPLAPPLREGTTYVLRATDFTGALMRVVVDAHSGAIRDTNRMMSGPGNYPVADSEADSSIGMAYQEPSEDLPASFIVLPAGSMPSAIENTPVSTMQALVENPPLPRPRPAFAERTASGVKGPAANRAND